MNRNPKYRPLSIRLANACGAAAISARLVDRKLDADRLMAQARQRTGLEDF